MKDSIVRLRNLCDMLIGMGFTESVNEKEIKKLIKELEAVIYREMELLKDRESMSDL